MGADQTIYIGIYLECILFKMNAETYGFGCKNGHESLFRNQHKFCPECGLPIEPIKIITTIPRNWSHIMEKLEYREAPIEHYLMEICGEQSDQVHDFLVSNNETLLPMGKHFDSGTIKTYPLGLTPASFILDWKEQYADLLGILRKEYASIEVKYGLIIDWN